MALDKTQIAINLAKAVIEKTPLPETPQEAAKTAVVIYETILQNLTETSKPVKRLPL